MRIKHPLFLILLLVPFFSFSQRLYVGGTESTGTVGFGFVEMANGTFVPLDSLSATESVVLDLWFHSERVVAFRDSIREFHLSQLSISQPFPGSGMAQVHGANVLISTYGPPHLRYLDPANGYQEIWSIDSTKLRGIPTDLEIVGDTAYLALGEDIILVDLQIGDTVGRISTGHLYALPGMGQGQFLEAVGRDLYIVVDYFTGAPRWSLLRMEISSMTVDSLLFKEFSHVWTPPIAHNGKLYLGAFPNHYDIAGDSLAEYITLEHRYPVAVDPDNGNLICFHADSIAVESWDGAAFSGYTPLPFQTTHIESFSLQPASMMDIENQGNPMNIHVGPNPSKGVLHIIPGNPGVLSLFNIRGKKICEMEINGEKEMNLEALNPGVYVLRFADRNGGIATVKWLKL